MQIKIYFELFVTFLKIGAFTIGGGYAMIPIIQNQVVDEKKWLDEEEFTDFATMSQSLPGIIAVNLSTCVGMKVKGKKGALVATSGMVLPSLISIVLIAAAYNKIIENVTIQNAFKGARATVTALVIYAVIRLSKTSITYKPQIIIAASAFILALVFNISPPIIIITAALICIFLKPIK